MATLACGRENSAASGSSPASPVTAATKAPMRMARPKPPESTTPFSLRTGKNSGVRLTDASDSSAMARRVSWTVAPDCAAATAAAQESSSTVRMVPLTGLRTAWKATATERCMAAAMASASTSSTPSKPSHRPRRIWLVMTPELPRAPMSEPWVTALHRALESAPMGSALTSLATDSMVSDMLVPVSPSGTGKTLRRLTSSLRSASAAAADAMQTRSSVMFMCCWSLA